MTERTKQIELVITLSVIGLLIIGTVYIIFPFLPAALWAVIFAVSVWPVFVKIEKTLGGRSALAAALLTLLLLIIFLVPLVFVGAKLADKVPLVSGFADRIIKEGLPAPPEWLKGIPLVGKSMSDLWNEYSREPSKLIEAVRPYVNKLTSWMLATGAEIGQLVLLTLLSLVFVFFFLKDGRPIAAALDAIARRIGGTQGHHLLLVAAATMSSVVYGILGSAIAQGILATIGLWIAGVPNALFFGIAVGVLALIPLGLIMLILIPASLWLFYTGQTGWGIFLIIWSFGVVGNADNFIRPVLISRGAQLPMVVVLIGVLAGLAAGGILGLFVGATLLGVFYTLLKEWSTPSPDIGEGDRPGDGTG